MGGVRAVPDGFTGAIMAIEGIEDAVVLLHGPGGCRIRHMVLSSAVFNRSGEGAEFSEPYYYGYPRVPATYLDEYDFINGAYYKSEEGLETVAGRSPSLVVIVDSPGAGLIGDDHDGAIAEAGLSGIAMHISEPLASVPATRGCGHALESVMRFLGPERGETRPGTVNLLGLSVMDKDWAAARDELCGYLRDMGLEVACCPGAGSSVADMVRSVDSEFNVVVCPEMCAGLRGWYGSMGVPSIVSPAGAPVGFDALEEWIRTVAEATGRDPSIPLERVRSHRIRVRDKFNGMRYNALRMRGLTFSAAGTASVVRPLTEWLYSYLAMAPEAVCVDDGADPDQTDALRAFLESKGFGDAWGREPVPCGAVLCEGITALSMMISHECRVGIPIGHSSMGLDDVIPRPVYGAQGALYILDELLHGVRAS
ncbi:MAG: nitrogenase component 1 [Thermoplasmata archaeon]|nr:nitrogenase component 1 [Thermoplasmata archaeon]